MAERSGGGPARARTSNRSGRRRASVAAGAGARLSRRRRPQRPRESSHAKRLIGSRAARRFWFHLRIISVAAVGRGDLVPRPRPAPCCVPTHTLHTEHEQNLGSFSRISIYTIIISLSAWSWRLSAGPPPRPARRARRPRRAGELALAHSVTSKTKIIQI
ncbi:hypothetical protein EVAR_43588_1 [Eumeta japonica]|uniref:Uncharacterized protein n=1 Tax=Eumeta variegata TaxID=151549 RepID=A0A4C1XCN4_EUMVA|nr:hypothetical protein EVAR_43588_1 [Eumeta japonica]